MLTIWPLEERLDCNFLATRIPQNVANTIRAIHMRHFEKILNQKEIRKYLDIFQYTLLLHSVWFIVAILQLEWWKYNKYVSLFMSSILITNDFFRHYLMNSSFRITQKQTKQPEAQSQPQRKQKRWNELLNVIAATTSWI